MDRLQVNGPDACIYRFWELFKSIFKLFPDIGSVETIEYYNEIGQSVDAVGDDASE
jgi:hypothetical protein